MSPILGDEVWAALADSAGRWPRSVCLRMVGLDPFTYLPWTAFPKDWSRLLDGRGCSRLCGLLPDDRLCHLV